MPVFIRRKRHVEVEEGNARCNDSLVLAGRCRDSFETDGIHESLIQHLRRLSSRDNASCSIPWQIELDVPDMLEFVQIGKFQTEFAIIAKHGVTVAT